MNGQTEMQTSAINGPQYHEGNTTFKTEMHGKDLNVSFGDGINKIPTE